MIKINKISLPSKYSDKRGYILVQHRYNNHTIIMYSKKNNIHTMTIKKGRKKRKLKPIISTYSLSLFSFFLYHPCHPSKLDSNNSSSPSSTTLQIGVKADRSISLT